jgi:hypothetical protein
MVSDPGHYSYCDDCGKYHYSGWYEGYCPSKKVGWQLYRPVGPEEEMYHFVEVYKPEKKSNPIFFALASDKIHTGWYFWNETWTDWNGPFVSYSEAKDELALYALDLDCDPEYTGWSKAVFDQAEAE